MQFGLIGEKLGHSFSKQIHERIGGSYTLCELSREELGGFMKSRDFCGINVTIPYKKAVIPMLDEVSEEALGIGAVNTVVNRGGRLFGYNTDLFGLIELIKRVIGDSSKIKGKKALVLGTGGTSLTAVAALASLGAGKIVRVSRSTDKTGDRGISGNEGSTEGDPLCLTVSYSEAAISHTDACIIINCTPRGMYPGSFEEPCLDISSFEALVGVVDCIYNPLRTRLVLDARERGIPAEGGLYMLVAQAIKAHELFTGEELPEGLYEELYRALLSERENIVLAGMPSCGKSTVGMRLSQLLSRSFFDSDLEIVKKDGREITDIFSSDGEEYFRNIESAVISELSLSASGGVIATGGGAVLRAENVRRLKANGRLFFIDRELSKLTPTASRPLSSDIAALSDKYRTRYPIYSAVCDSRIDGNGSVDEVAELIIKEKRR